VDANDLLYRGSVVRVVRVVAGGGGRNGGRSTSSVLLLDNDFFAGVVVLGTDVGVCGRVVVVVAVGVDGMD